MKVARYQAADFGVRRRQVSRFAAGVVEQLQNAGFDGYLVGGCVRDLLLGKVPKDFDVTTNATPEQVKKLFPRARIIGRRFKIVHVRDRREIIEVATYRADPRQQKKKSWFGLKRNPVGESGRILDDNVWGTIEDDAVRRDFTINALYYDPVNEEILDFLGGVADIEQGRLRMIGKPAARFAEDPVRMLRVIRFMAKLDLELDSGLSGMVEKHCHLLAEVPSARLFDEVLKMFHHAHGVRSWEELENYGMLPLLFEQTADAIAEPGGDRWRDLIITALQNTDRRISQDKPVIPAFLYTVLLWRPFSERFAALCENTRNIGQALHQASDEVFSVQSLQVAIPKRVSGPATEIWQMQNALERRRPRSVRSLLESRRFRAAYDFLMLRARIGEVDQSLVDWWTRIQDCSQEVREQMIDEVAGHDQKKGQGRGPGGGRGKNQQGGSTAQVDGQPTEGAPKKKRRRRRRKRKPAGEQSSGQSGQQS